MFAAVLMGPPAGEIEVSVGGGGLVMVTGMLFETDGVEVLLATVMLAVPAAVNRLAGTVAAI